MRIMKVFNLKVLASLSIQTLHSVQYVGSFQMLSTKSAPIQRYGVCNSVRFRSTSSPDQETTSTSTPMPNPNPTHMPTTNGISLEDCQFMNMAVDHAKNGFGNTYPNPAVGCVLVANDESDSKVIGSGFHPKAGYPHAEIFALFEACGHVDSGISAAKSVVSLTSSSTKDKPSDQDIIQTVKELSDIYSGTSNGPEKLFGERLLDQNVTAYVTLEPCCHYGKTPPCAATFVKAGVKRVVIGYRDPNPRVDGGGCLVLQDAGINVDLMPIKDGSVHEETDDVMTPEHVAKQCAIVVEAFAKRISPRRTLDEGLGMTNYDTYMNGAKRSALRSLAGKKKRDGTMTEISWQDKSSIDMKDTKTTLEQKIDLLHLNHQWLELIDRKLWQTELVILKLNNAVKKKKGVKLLGEKIAKELDAHVSQVVGHTVLLYRPGLPPVLDLEQLIDQ